MKVLLVAHITEVPGPVQSLAEYFEGKNIDFYKMYFPIDGAKVHLSLFSGMGKLIEKKEIKKMGAIRYLWDFFHTLIWLKKIKPPLDKAIGTNCLAVLPLIIFKKFYGIKQVIYFNSDYSRQRFANPLHNAVYVIIDKFCAKRSDKICCNTKRTISARIAEGIKKEKIIYTPNGVFPKDIGNLDVRKKKFKRRILFVGYLSEERGLQNVIKLMPKINFYLDLIGSGSFEDSLKKLTRQLGVEKRVKFLGLKTHKEVITYLKNFSGFGLAPYSMENKTDWIWYCDPVKVKEYLSCLVPVIISNIPEISGLVKKNNLGFVYKSEQEITEIIRNVATLSESTYRKMLVNIEKIRGDFDLNSVYKKI